MRTRAAKQLVRQAGFSLVELMVGLAIGVFLIAGTLSVYQESQAAILVSERMVRMQESGRYALSVIEQDIRAVGLWGLLNRTEFVAGRATPADPVDLIVNSDCEANWTVNIDTPIEGSNGVNPYGASCLAGVDYMPGSDVLVVRHADEIDLAAGDLVAGGVYLRSDQTHAEIFQGTTLPGGFAAGARINELRSTAYFVSTSSDTDDQLPSLRRIVIDDSGAIPALTTEEVIIGVEDMQVQYGVDLTGDGSANSYVNADGVADPSQVVSLRLWLRMRTMQPENGFEDDIVWEYSDQRFDATATADTTDDAFRRTLVSKTIELRNRRVSINNGA